MFIFLEHKEKETESKSGSHIKSEDHKSKGKHENEVNKKHKSYIENKYSNHINNFFYFISFINKYTLAHILNYYINQMTNLTNIYLILFFENISLFFLLLYCFHVNKAY